MQARIVQCAQCGQKNRVPATADGHPVCGACRQALPWIVDASDDDFAETAGAASLPVLVDLWAPWCGPCRMVSPVLEQLAGEFAGRMKLVKVDVDRAPTISRTFQVRAVPTLMILHRGKLLAYQPGAAGSGVLRAWIEDVLAQVPALDAEAARSDDRARSAATGEAGSDRPGCGPLTARSRC